MLKSRFSPKKILIIFLILILFPALSLILEIKTVQAFTFGEFEWEMIEPDECQGGIPIELETGANHSFRFSIKNIADNPRPTYIELTARSNYFQFISSNMGIPQVRNDTGIQYFGWDFGTIQPNSIASLEVVLKPITPGYLGGVGMIISWIDPRREPNYACNPWLPTITGDPITIPAIPIEVFIPPIGELIKGEPTIMQGEEEDVTINIINHAGFSADYIIANITATLINDGVVFAENGEQELLWENQQINGFSSLQLPVTIIGNEAGYKFLEVKAQGVDIYLREVDERAKNRFFVQEKERPCPQITINPSSLQLQVNENKTITASITTQDEQDAQIKSDLIFGEVISIDSINPLLEEPQTISNVKPITYTIDLTGTTVGDTVLGFRVSVLEGPNCAPRANLSIEVTEPEEKPPPQISLNPSLLQL
jgi:hypothetical protein